MLLLGFALTGSLGAERPLVAPLPECPQDLSCKINVPTTKLLCFHGKNAARTARKRTRRFRLPELARARESSEPQAETRTEDEGSATGEKTACRLRARSDARRAERISPRPPARRTGQALRACPALNFWLLRKNYSLFLTIFAPSFCRRFSMFW